MKRPRRIRDRSAFLKGVGGTLHRPIRSLKNCLIEGAPVRSLVLAILTGIAFAVRGSPHHRAQVRLLTPSRIIQPIRMEQRCLAPSRPTVSSATWPSLTSCPGAGPSLPQGERLSQPLLPTSTPFQPSSWGQLSRRNRALRWLRPAEGVFLRILINSSWIRGYRALWTRSAIFETCSTGSLRTHIPALLLTQQWDLPRSFGKQRTQLWAAPTHGLSPRQWPFLNPRVLC